VQGGGDTGLYRRTGGGTQDFRTGGGHTNLIQVAGYLKVLVHEIFVSCFLPYANLQGPMNEVSECLFFIFSQIR
jgi:hypothetical protein